MRRCGRQLYTPQLAHHGRHTRHHDVECIECIRAISVTTVLEVKVEAQLLVLVTSYPLTKVTAARFHIFIPREERCYVVPHVVLEVGHVLCDEARVVLGPHLLIQLEYVLV